ncbi:MAG: hydrogenase [Treponema sp.]|jgi:nitrogenase molybdenum-iron protein beta chain|nr:hydrogenase [Treponema sp.]
MAKLLYQPRYKCALAAMQTVHAIPRAIPVLHSGPGCASKLNDNNGTSGMYSPNIFPCTSVSEKEVVFGGTDKLRSTIENSLKIIDADLFVVLTGCTSEIIGDDAGEVAGEFAAEEKKVIFANTPGFKGNNYLGHDWVLQAIFDQYLPKTKTAVQTGLVNIFSAPPMQDAFWLGNLREIESLAVEIGLTPNTIFGHNRGLPNIDRIPAAQLNLLIGPWAGLESVRFLEKKYGTPFLHYPVLPIGAFETSRFLRTLAEKTGVDKSLSEKVISDHEEEYYYYIERYSDVFLEQRVMSKRFVTVADAHYALAFTKFLVNDLGMFPVTQFITDDTPEQYRESLVQEFRSLNYGIAADVVFSSDGGEIHRKIKETAFGGFPLILGSSWEKRLARELYGIFVNITYPMVARMVINGHVAGYSGGLKMLEDIYTEARERLAL